MNTNEVKKKNPHNMETRFGLCGLYLFYQYYVLSTNTIEFRRIYEIVIHQK